MFSLVSVCSQGGPHMTITHDALNLTVQGPPPLQDLRLLHASDICRPRPETCSNLFT